MWLVTAVRWVSRSDVFDQVGVIDAQTSGCVEGQGEVALILVSDRGGLVRGRVEVHPHAGHKECGQVEFLEPTRPGINSPEWLRIGSHPRERAVIDGAQAHVVVSVGMKVDVGAARHVHAKSRVGKVIESRAAVVPDIEHLKRRPIRDEELTLRSPVVTGFEELLPKVDPVYESGLGFEVGTEIEVLRLQVEPASDSFKIECVAESVYARSSCDDVVCGTAHCLTLQAPVLIEFDIRVDASNAVVSTGE